MRQHRYRVPTAFSAELAVRLLDTPYGGQYKSQPQFDFMEARECRRDGCVRLERHEWPGKTRNAAEIPQNQPNQRVQLIQLLPRRIQQAPRSRKFADWIEKSSNWSAGAQP